MMTKKHFKAIAEILKTSETKKEIIKKMILFCREQNPYFDREKFATACGYIEE